MTLLTVEELKLRVVTALDESVLQDMLDAAESAITDYAGPLGAMTEILDGGGSYVFLRRRAASVEKVTETVWNTVTELDDADWRLRKDGVSVLRLQTGPNPPAFWGAQGFYGPEFGLSSDFYGAILANQSTAPWGHKVVAEYTPLDDMADRKRVQADLVKLDISYVPGVILERIGEWEERRDRGTATWNDTEEREAILASLQPQAYAPGFA